MSSSLWFLYNFNRIIDKQRSQSLMMLLFTGGGGVKMCARQTSTFLSLKNENRLDYEGGPPLLKRSFGDHLDSSRQQSRATGTRRVCQHTGQASHGRRPRLLVGHVPHQEGRQSHQGTEAGVSDANVNLVDRHGFTKQSLKHECLKSRRAAGGC